jgi:hypothetical protein
MVAFLLSYGRTDTVPEDALGAGLLWLVVVLLVVALGGLAVWAVHRPRALWRLVAAGVVAWIVPAALAESAASTIGGQLPVTGPAPRHLHIPYSGGAAVALLAVFVLLNVAASYAAWRLVVRRAQEA